MAIGWMTVLQAVPWTEVINNAPRIAEGAKKLWSAAARRTPAPQAAAGPNPLDARVAALEATVGELQGELLASSELIRSLAEQNAQLVRRIEANRVRLTQLVAALVVTAGLASAGLVLAVLRTVG